MLLADVYEAILGACFMAHHSFRDPYRFLAATNHPLTVAAKPLDHRKLIDVAIALPLDSTLPLFDNPETTFR
jgi:hypothetical protein